jgi:hypothetical protein
VKAQKQHSRADHSTAFIRARVDQRLRLCLLDSGADVCLIPRPWVNSSRVKPTHQNFLAANETQVIVDGEIRLPLHVDSTRTYANFLVSLNVGDTILGRDWLVQNSVVWRFEDDIVQVQGQQHPLIIKDEARRQCCGVTKTPTVVPPRSEAIVRVHVIRSSLKLNTATDSWSSALAESKKGCMLLTR